MAKSTVGGEVRLDYTPSGLVWRLTCPAMNALERRGTVKTIPNWGAAARHARHIQPRPSSRSPDCWRLSFELPQYRSRGCLLWVVCHEHLRSTRRCARRRIFGTKSQARTLRSYQCWIDPVRLLPGRLPWNAPLDSIRMSSGSVAVTTSATPARNAAQLRLVKQFPTRSPAAVPRSAS